MDAPAEATPALPAAIRSVAVVAPDELLIRRLRDALAADGLGVLDHASAVRKLTATAADADAIVFAGLKTATQQRDMLRAAAERASHLPTVLVATLSANGVRKALDAGACGVVPESAIESALSPTVRAVCAGQVVVPHRFRHAIRPPLSHREKQTLALVARGLTNREIAAQLYLAESTVKTHLGSIFAKLGVGSRSEATALVLDPDENLGMSVVELAAGPPGAG